jgi:parallel beta-helix repeat protein
MRILPVVGSLLALLAPTGVWAATIKVPADQPTIQAAIDAAQSGDVIAVSGGAHGAFVVDGKSGLTIKGKGDPIVDGAGAAGSVVTIRNAQDVTLDGFVVQNSLERLVDILASQDVTVRRCTFTNGEDGVRAHDGSTGVLIEKNRFTAIDNDAVDFTADETPSPAASSRVQKNQFENVGDEAIELEGSGHVVEKNKIRNVASSGITLSETTEGITVAKNRLEAVVDTAIEAEGTNHVVEKNTLRGVGTDDEEGISLKGSGHRVEKNKIDAAGDEGIDVEASDCEVRSNKVTNAGDSGFEVGELDSPGVTTNNLFERNTVTGSAANGFYVVDTGNTFTRNKASKSGTFDLLDETVPGGNVYDKNKFGTSQIP